MNKPVVEVQNIIVDTGYFQECLENLLAVLQPSYFCLNLVVKVILHGPHGAGKRLLAKTAAIKLNMNFYEERVSDMFDENIAGTEKKVRAAITKSLATAPCLIYFSNYELFCKFEDSDLNRIEHCMRSSLDEPIQHDSENTQPIVFIASTNDFDTVYHSPLSNIVHHFIPVKSPTLAQAECILNSIKQNSQLESNPADLLSSLNDGEYYLGNLMNLVVRAEVDSRRGEEEAPSLRQTSHESIRWSDVGGLGDIKKEIIDAIQLSLKYPQLKKSGLRRTGILLYGPPGTGKTLLAKAVATESGLNFINVKGPELLNEYVGQSEDNVRKLFQKARDSSPSIIFFDEIDSLAPNRGQAGDSGGVMDRMVSQLLAEMDGVSKDDSVFVIGATNRADLVDPSLQRPGRFDKVLEVPLPTSRDSRLQILEALTRKMKLAQDVDLTILESIAPPNMSGADFQGLCSKAAHRTFGRCIEQVELGLKNEDNVEIITSMDDFVLSLEEN